VRYKVLGRLGGATRDSIAEIQPAYIVIVPDWTSTGDMVHPSDFPADVFAALGDGSLGYRRVAQYHSPGLIRRRRLDYPTYNPVVTVFARADRALTWRSGPPE
jgi:hypothetical protein